MTSSGKVGLCLAVHRRKIWVLEATKPRHLVNEQFNLRLGRLGATCIGPLPRSVNRSNNACNTTVKTPADLADIGDRLNFAL